MTHEFDDFDLIVGGKQTKSSYFHQNSDTIYIKYVPSPHSHNIWQQTEKNRNQRALNTPVLESKKNGLKDLPVNAPGIVSAMFASFFCVFFSMP